MTAKQTGPVRSSGRDETSDKGPAIERMTKEELATFVAGKSVLTKIEAMKKTIKQLEALRNSLLQSEDRPEYLSRIKKMGNIAQNNASGGVIRRRGGGIAKRGFGIAK